MNPFNYGTLPGNDYPNTNFSQLQTSKTLTKIPTKIRETANEIATSALNAKTIPWPGVGEEGSATEGFNNNPDSNQLGL